MPKTAVIAGVGPGLGAALVRKFAREGCQVGMFARSREYLGELERELKKEKLLAMGVPVDLSQPEQVASGFEQVREKFGPVDILVNHASASSWKGLLELSLDEFVTAWEVTVKGAFLCSREAVPDMLEKGEGKVLFTGATSAIRGRKGALAFSSAKFGARGLADAMARELWPRGIHVAHVVIDGMIDTPRVREQQKPGPAEPLLNPDEIAEVYWSLVVQKPSAWTFELEVRPNKEEFFL